jgi:hypothetical protein
LLLPFLFFRRERTFLIPVQRNTRHRHLRGSACGQQGRRPSERYKFAPSGLRQSLSYCACPLRLPCRDAGLA